VAAGAHRRLFFNALSVERGCAGVQSSRQRGDAEKAEIQLAAHLSDPVAFDLKADEKKRDRNRSRFIGLDEIAPCVQLRVKAIMLLPR
jgi:hypothetical protein